MAYYGGYYKSAGERYEDYRHARTMYNLTMQELEKQHRAEYARRKALGLPPVNTDKCDKAVIAFGATFLYGLLIGVPVLAVLAFMIF